MSEESEKIRASVTEHAKSIGLEMTASFVPQSISRNANDKNKSLNWKITLKRGNRSLETDYMQGIGHVPDYPMSWGSETIDQHTKRQTYDKAAETGRYPKPKTAWQTLPVPTPELTDVLYALVLDASVLDCNGFEDWASELGYDTDSRKAEQTYRACIESALQLRSLIGAQEIENLRSLLEGY